MQLELNAKGINTTTVAITDYKMISAGLARVILSTSGDPTKEQVSAHLSKQLQNLAAPVENSFRNVKAGVTIGYIRANRPVRAIDNPQELRASYKTMATNILMDKQDNTLWEVKQGAGGTFLARHGNEDLSELVEASLNPRQGVPRLHHITQASVAKREFVAFASAAGEMDYGFCVASNKEKGLVKVVSFAQRKAVVVQTEAIASVIPTGEHGVRIPKAAHDRIVKAGITRSDAEQEIAYYTRLYSYDPAYLEEVIEQVEGTASM